MSDLPVLAVTDIALRGAAVAVLLLLGGLLLRDQPGSQAARLGALFALGGVAYAIASAPGTAAAPAWWHVPLLAVSSANAVMFWLFARALFDDGFTARPWHAAVWVVFAAGAPVQVYYPPGAAFCTLLAAGRVCFALLAVAQTLATWQADLVEGRRRFRVFTVAAIAAFIIADAASGWADDARDLVGPGSAAGLLAMALAIGWPLLRVAGGGLFPAAPPGASADAPPARPGPAPVPAATGTDLAEARQLAALQRLIAVERIHRREGLTIGALAGQLGLPEYRLRRLINRGLGFRNFNAFLNHYRIAEVRQALADPAQAAVPVLTLALDAGFQSLGPFNRAFRAETGLTPTEYRRQRQMAAVAGPAENRADSGIGQRA